MSPDPRPGVDLYALVSDQGEACVMVRWPPAGPTLILDAADARELADLLTDVAAKAEALRARVRPAKRPAKPPRASESWAAPGMPPARNPAYAPASDPLAAQYPDAETEG